MTIIDGLCQVIFNTYEAFTAAIYVREGEMLHCLSSVTFAGSFDRNRDIPVEGSLPGWVIKHHETLIIPNFDKDEDALGYYGTTEGIKSFMGYPIEGEGIIVVDSKKKYVFTDKEKKILGGFGALIFQNLEQERRFQEMEERIEELSRDRRILHLFKELSQASVTVTDVLGECADFSGADFAFTAIEKGGKVALRDRYPGETGAVTGGEYPMGQSIASVVIEGGRELLLPHSSGFLRERPLLFQGETLRAKQFFGFPLTEGEQVFGLAGFGSTSATSLREHAIGSLREVSLLLSLYYAALLRKESSEKVMDLEPVTGALHFSAFLRILDSCVKAGEPFSLLSLKLTDLAEWNRKLGPDYTNRLLKKAFKVLRYCAGGKALIARKGGGHFYVLLRGNGILEVNNVLKVMGYTIRKSMAEEKWLEGLGNLETGVARFPDDGNDLWDLLDRASRNRKPA